MLTILRSKLWRHGATAITGSCATTQAGQTNSGRCLWYSAITHKVVAFGSSLKKLLTSEEPLIIPSIEGSAATRQAPQRTDAEAQVSFVGDGATIQPGQFTNAVARVIQPISGSAATVQDTGWDTAHAENVDVELEILAAILSAA